MAGWIFVIMTWLIIAGPIELIYLLFDKFF